MCRYAEACGGPRTPDGAPRRLCQQSEEEDPTDFRAGDLEADDHVTEWKGQGK